MDLLPERGAPGSALSWRFGFRVRRHNAPAIEQKIIDERDGFSGARTGDRQDVTVIRYPDELVAERADKFFPPGLARVIFERPALQYDFRPLPSRLRGRLLLQIARTQPARYVACEVF